MLSCVSLDSYYIAVCLAVLYGYLLNFFVMLNRYDIS